jgi:hypothetical protein
MLLLAGGACSGWPRAARAEEQCGDAYPGFTRFVVEDGGVDWAGNPVRLCSEYLRLGGERMLGLPISRPFRVGSELYQAFEYGVLSWRQDLGQAELVDALDLLHTAGRDPLLERLGIPPAQEPGLDWLTDEALSASRGRDPRGVFGLPTSPPTPIGPYVAQRFQRAVARRWVEPVPYDIAGSLSRAPDGSRIERVMAGDLLRSSGLIPAAALIADPGVDPDQYNWLAVPSTAESLWRDPPAALGGWQGLYHRAGAFNIGSLSVSDEEGMRAEVDQAADLGFNLAVNAYVGRDSKVVQSGLDRNLLLIDTYPWDRIAAACGGAARTRGCQLSDDQLGLLEEQIRHHLLLTRLDDSVVAYWVLDDDPGDVRPAIELIHRLVQEESLLDRQARPTVCGFGGELDEAGRPVAQTRAAFDRAVRNFTPTGCDAVALYPYRRQTATRETPVDWSMRDLLPYMLQRLEERGWDKTSQPLIGIPQAFAFGPSVPPRPSEVVAQTTAYCAVGASAIVFYAWNDSYTGLKAQLFNSPELRQAASDGLDQCRAVWGERQ